ncbi:Uncharacterised protein [uncultured archaeon]|nr:Uncharacterised protein [uncultured archaeon]
MLVTKSTPNFPINPAPNKNVGSLTNELYFLYLSFKGSSAIESEVLDSLNPRNPPILYAPSLSASAKKSIP